ncbi:MAG: SAM-dependent chlorinase/fluorinase [Planctomycetes bacterium]|nr:SAM-dependent chlorinase/fluorinase [Planctomycetota bacterium]
MSGGASRGPSACGSRPRSCSSRRDRHAPAREIPLQVEEGGRVHQGPPVAGSPPPCGALVRPGRPRGARRPRRPRLAVRPGPGAAGRAVLPRGLEARPRRAARLGHARDPRRGRGGEPRRGRRAAEPLRAGRAGADPAGPRGISLDPRGPRDRCALPHSRVPGRPRDRARAAEARGPGRGRRPLLPDGRRGIPARGPVPGPADRVVRRARRGGRAFAGPGPRPGGTVGVARRGAGARGGAGPLRGPDPPGVPRAAHPGDRPDEPPRPRRAAGERGGALARHAEARLGALPHLRGPAHGDGAPARREPPLRPLSPGDVRGPGGDPSPPIAGGAHGDPRVTGHQARPEGRGSGPTVTLLTDFGLRDSYVAAMKGVLAARAPEARVVDLCHEVPPQDIRAAGLIWAGAVPYFPRGCVHVAVVDPGVGSRRKIIAAEGKGSTFLAPDNGLLGYVLRGRDIHRAFEVRCPRLYLKPVSATFHGRDVFAPVAAALAGGLPLEAVGPPARRLVPGGVPGPRRRHLGGAGRHGLEVRGEVIHIDVFGNAVTSLRLEPGLRIRSLEVGPLRFPRLSRTYSAAVEGEPVALVGSSGYIEVAVYRGSAAREQGIRVGDPVVGQWG